MSKKAMTKTSPFAAFCVQHAVLIQTISLAEAIEIPNIPNFPAQHTTPRAIAGQSSVLFDDKAAANPLDMDQNHNAKASATASLIASDLNSVFPPIESEQAIPKQTGNCFEEMHTLINDPNSDSKQKEHEKNLFQQTANTFTKGAKTVENAGRTVTDALWDLAWFAGWFYIAYNWGKDHGMWEGTEVQERQTEVMNKYTAALNECIDNLETEIALLRRNEEFLREQNRILGGDNIDKDQDNIVEKKEETIDKKAIDKDRDDTDKKVDTTKGEKDNDSDIVGDLKKSESSADTADEESENAEKSDIAHTIEQKENYLLKEIKPEKDTTTPQLSELPQLSEFRDWIFHEYGTIRYSSKEGKIVTNTMNFNLDQTLNEMRDRVKNRDTYKRNVDTLWHLWSQFKLEKKKQSLEEKRRSLENLFRSGGGGSSTTESTEDTSSAEEGTSSPKSKADTSTESEKAKEGSLMKDGSSASTGDQKASFDSTRFDFAGDLSEYLREAKNGQTKFTGASTDEQKKKSDFVGDVSQFWSSWEMMLRVMLNNVGF